MPALTDDQIARLLTPYFSIYKDVKGANATYPKAVPIEQTQAAMAFAIVLAESGGDPKKIGQLDKDDRGLWQFNRRHHPEVSDQCAFDAACSTKEAYRVSKNGTDWSQWNTWKNGSYKKHLTRAGQALGGYTSGEAVEVEIPVVEDVIEGAVDWTKALGRALAWFTRPENIIRVVKVIVGVLIALIGLSLLVKTLMVQSETAQEIGKAIA